MIFHSFFILALIPLVVFLVLAADKTRPKAGLRFSSRALFKGLPGSFKARLSGRLYILRAVSLVLIVIALARPRSPIADSRIRSEGIDILLAVDCSTSMLAEDFKVAGRRQNRLEAVKDVVKDFIQLRQSDRIGIVAFAARAYTVCPLTLDYAWLLENLSRIKTGMIEDGTAIGSGIASSLNRLKDLKSRSKVVILLTDGRNNAGKISPLTAAEAAESLKVKVYTIGAGSKGLAPYPVKDLFGNTVYQPVEVDIDEDTLKKIARKTGALYFRAADTESLRQIYQEIDKLEKSPIEEKGYQEYKELFPYFLLVAIGLLLIEIVLGNTILRRLP